MIKGNGSSKIYCEIFMQCSWIWGRKKDECEKREREKEKEGREREREIKWASVWEQRRKTFSEK